MAITKVLSQLLSQILNQSITNYSLYEGVKGNQSTFSQVLTQGRTAKDQINKTKQQHRQKQKQKKGNTGRPSHPQL